MCVRVLVVWKNHFYIRDVDFTVVTLEENSGRNSKHMAGLLSLVVLIVNCIL